MRPHSSAEARVASDRHGLGAAVCSKLTQDNRDVIAHGLLRYLQPDRDVSIAQTVCKKFQDLALPRGQFIERIGRAIMRARGKEFVELIHELPPSGLGAEQNVIAALERHKLCVRN